MRINKLMMFGCFRGIAFLDAWFNEIDDLVIYASTGLAVAFNTSQGRGNIIHRLNYESMNLGWMADNPLVYLYDGTYVQIDFFYNWPSAYSPDIRSITNDDSRLEKACLAFNLKNSGIMELFRDPVVIPAPFGGIIERLSQMVIFRRWATAREAWQYPPPE